VNGGQRVAAYRSGYPTEDRRQLEEALRAGPILGLATTTALELGINITGLDAVLIAGWPGTRAAVWQQAGRAGREGQAAVAVLIARDDPLDTYLVHHPEALLDRPVEATVLDPGNPYVLAPHLCAAAAELPLAPADLAMFGPSAAEVADTLVGRGMLRRRSQHLYWTRRGRAAEAGLRGTGGRPLKIVEKPTGRLVGTVDEPSAHIMVHTGAVYPHQGELYLVTELDLARGVALVEHGDPGYATSARNITGIDVITELRRADWGPAAVHFGEVEVMRQVTSFTRRHPETGQPLGEFPLDLPPRALRTRAVWWTISGGQRAALLRRGVDLPGAAHAAEHTSIGLLPLFAACDRWDIGGVSADLHPATGADRSSRRARGRGGLRRARLRRGPGLAGRHPAGHRRLRVRHRLPVLCPVTQVRQRQRAAEQGRCAAAAGPPAGTAARKRPDGRRKPEMRRPPPGGRAGVAVRLRIPEPSSRKA
jgi:DEAD/DEAH box helicase domain-containing protein